MYYFMVCWVYRIIYDIQKQQNYPTQSKYMHSRLSKLFNSILVGLHSRQLGKILGKR